VPSEQGSQTFLKLRATSCVPINAKGYYCSLIQTNEINILLNLSSVILVLIFVNVKTLIMLMLFLERARGHHVGDPWLREMCEKKCKLAYLWDGHCV